MITYKHFYPENVERTDYCDEYETSVEDITVIDRIFARLDFRRVVDVEKVRSTWHYEGVEVAIDNVAGLGCYIELEAIEAFEDPKEGKPYLYRVLERLNAQVGDEENRGYPFILLGEKKDSS